MFTLSKPGEGGKKEESILDKVGAAIDQQLAKATNGAVPENEKKQDKDKDGKEKGTLEKVADKLDQDLAKATNNAVPENKKEKDQEPEKDKAKGFGDLRGGRDIGQDVFAQVGGRDVSDRLGNSALLLGSDRQASMPRDLSAITPEAGGGAHAFNLSNGPVRDTGLRLQATAPTPAPLLTASMELPPRSPVAAAWEGLANVPRSSRIQTQERGLELGQQQGQMPARAWS
ncbi:MAG: hypothetical protein PW734_11380 [Verrucomicrobium sp.]|nr:hypothetical protein [Verrucomicrobium sp.]